MYGLHILETKPNAFTFVGTIPISLCIVDVATKSDVMAGRAFRDQYGILVAPKIPIFDNVEAAIAHVKAKGHFCTSVITI